MREHRVVVVGAGIAGLSTALDLASRGIEVVVLERAAEPGGKLRQVVVDGAGIDSGPTVFTMRWVFDALLADAGTTLEAELPLAPLGVLARHAWHDGSRLDLFADAARSTDAIAAFAGPAEARRFAAFRDEARRVYRALEGPYIRSPRPGPMQIMRGLGIDGLAALWGLGPMSDLWRSLARHFHDPRMQQLFGRYATYCGASPFRAPATLVLIAQVEMDGVWSVGGGMVELARMLARVARRRGATIRCNAQVERIVVEGGRARGVMLADGERIDADAVVFNGDVGALASGLLGAPARGATAAVPPAARSLSALTWSMRAPTSGFPLSRHNVFFDEDYASEFSDVFGRGQLPTRPTVYVCAQDRGDDTELSGPERLLCLVNAPAAGDARPFDLPEIEQCERRAFSLLARCGLQVERRPGDAVTTSPADFERLFPATGGALYGRASHGWLAQFRRSSSRSRLPGLWLAGGSVHPGPGVPMAAMSGRLAAAALTASLVSTSRSSPVATSGGTSTP
ncbi:MAG: phytoene desaturase family protein [Burkholderiales bacterium]|nr:phytoene desaturase family protein [Burkholderiales bacterium]